MAEELNRSLKYTDWNPYLHSVNDDLNIINSLFPDCYELGKGNTKRLAINMQVFYMSRKAYIELPNVIKRINNVVETFHKPDFIKDYHEKKSNALQTELKAINILLECLGQITKRLSQNKLIPEVDITKIEKQDKMYEGVAV